ncbi:hypothetical protein [Thermaerobacter litoralis]
MWIALVAALAVVLWLELPPVWRLGSRRLVVVYLLLLATAGLLGFLQVMALRTPTLTDLLNGLLAPARWWMTPPRP